jgi:hypothetical protein
MEELLSYAQRVAYKYSRSSDPEIGSLAGAALRRATESYDPYRGLTAEAAALVRVMPEDIKQQFLIPPKRWVAIVVKQYVKDYWRKKSKHKEEQCSELWWSIVATFDESEEELVCQADWMLLYEKYIDRWPWDVVARRHGWSMKEARAAVNGAVQRFKEAFDARRAH